MLRAFFITTLLVLSLPVYAEEINVGFIQGVWYAHEPLIAGEPTRIYVALRNNSEHDLTGTVRFTDNGNRIGVAYVSALPGRIVEAWVDWTPGYGEHSIGATLTNAELHPIGGSVIRGEIANTLAQNEVFADLDTDSDDIPNEKDTDDDNDGVSDEAEIARGTDPLKENPKTIVQTEEEKGEQTEEKLSPNEPPGTHGLEAYMPQGRASDAITSLTETIAETKETLDAYRAERRNDLKNYFTRATISVTDNGATITRSRVAEDTNFLTSVIQGSKALLSGIYSLILALVSKLLSFPALIELFLLLFMVYAIYRTARRFGRRNI